MPAKRLPIPPPRAAQSLDRGRQIIRAESTALQELAQRLDERFVAAVERIVACRGNVVVAGIGKAGLVGQKISATFASTGTRSTFLHPTEALHGDLGRVGCDDLLLVLSFSGETAEIVQLLAAVQPLGTSVVAITGRPFSSLAREAAIVLELGTVHEACHLGLAPSTSTTAMLALGDALALVASELRGFTADDFGRYHPGGSLGRKLSKVEDVMRPFAECRVAHEEQSVREVFVAQSRPGRRTGAIMLVDAQGRLTGIFTDSDLARLLERKRDSAIDGPIGAVMTRGPAVARIGTRLDEACDLLAAKKISELPVVDAHGRPQGLLDITDVVGISFPADTTEPPPPPTLKIRGARGSQSRSPRVAKKGRPKS